MAEEQTMSRRLEFVRQTAQGLTDGQLKVLRNIVTNPNFRKEFASNPMGAVGTAGFDVTASELGRLEKLGPAQLEQLSHGVTELMKANEGCTHTLVYAIIVALLLA
jgi:hypothetical protein